MKYPYYYDDSPTSVADSVAGKIVSGVAIAILAGVLALFIKIANQADEIDCLKSGMPHKQGFLSAQAAQDLQKDCARWE